MTTKYGFISTYPPTQCGLATFTASLRGALTAAGAQGWVARLVDGEHPVAGPEVIADIDAGDAAGAGRATALLNQCDVVIAQHEFGVYGGADGQDVVTLLSDLKVPSIVVLHTVLVEPTSHQRQVLEAVVKAASAVVTMTRTAHDRLATGYNVDLSKVSTIAHGAPEPWNPAAATNAVFRSTQPTVLTWGLLGPGKGIEWAIQAMTLIRDLNPKYVVAGQTHPKVLAREGETYREDLWNRVIQSSLSASVSLQGQYRDTRSLQQLVSSADVVLLPYDSTDQVTSGVLIEAVAAGKPVVATAFPHAVELLTGGAGLVVPHHDPEAIAAALRSVLTGRGVAAAMSSAAAAAAPALRWPAVAERYQELAARLLADATVAA